MLNQGMNIFQTRLTEVNLPQTVKLIALKKKIFISIKNLSLLLDLRYFSFCIILILSYYYLKGIKPQVFIRNKISENKKISINIISVNSRHM